MLTAFDLDEYVYDAVKAGARGSLRKDAPPERPLAFVRSAGDADALLDPTIARRLIERYARPRILAKLDLRDRVQAAVLAYEQCLVEPGATDR
jgi:DNA-binding NarL/FixJ family response regulator